MPEIPIIGPEGKPIIYAYLDGVDLKFQFEYYGTGENGMDYEFIHTVEPENQMLIAEKFGLDPMADVLDAVQQISEAGQGEELKQALTDKAIPNHLWTWLS